MESVRQSLINAKLLNAKLEDLKNENESLKSAGPDISNSPTADMQGDIYFRHKMSFDLIYPSRVPADAKVVNEGWGTRYEVFADPNDAEKIKLLKSNGFKLKSTRK